MTELLDSTSTGRLQNVHLRFIGSSTDEDYLAGATDINVVDASDFEEDGGDNVTIDGTIYTTATVVYGDTEDDPDTLTLTSGLVADVEAGMDVDIVPLAQEMVGQVALDNNLDDVIDVLIDWSIQNQIQEGVRDPDDRESVNVEIIDGRYTVTSINGSIPILKTGSLDIPPLATDGLPPVETPAITVTPGIASLFITWNPLDPSGIDPPIYDVYLYTVPDTALTNAVLVTSTGGPMYQAFALADGTELVPGVQYYARTVARDADGAADPSNEASGTPLAGVSQADIDDLNDSLDQLGLDLDAANADLLNAESDISGLQGLFPITGTSISDGAITTPKMTADSINGDRITANTLAAAKIVAGSITTDRMTANTINGDRITTNTLNANKIVSNSITATQIAASTITGALIAANTITATQIAAGAVTASKIAANTITASQIAANTITAAQIAAATITAAQIAAGSITADRILVGVGSNFIANPGLETGDSAPHGLSSATSQTASNSAPRSGSYGLRIVCPTRTVGGFLSVLNGQPNNPLAHMPVTQGDEVHAEFWLRAGTASGQTGQLYADIRDAAGVHIAYATIPTAILTTTYQRFVADFTVTQTNAAYVCLAVGSNHCTAGDIIWMDDAILSKKVTGELIVNGAIDGTTITGAVIQTASGMGNTNGVSGMILEDDGTGGSIKFYAGIGTLASPETPGFINPLLIDATEEIPGIDIKTPTGTTSTGSPYTRWTRIRMSSGGVFAGSIVIDPGVIIDAGGGSGASAYLDVQGDIFGDGVFINNPPTTSNAANVRLGGAGQQLAQVTSLRRYKRDIKALTKEEVDSVLKIKPVSFLDAGEVKNNDGSHEGLRRIPGAVVEQVDKVAPLFTTQWEGKLNGLAYDRIAVALIPHINDHEKRLARVEELLATI